MGPSSPPVPILHSPTKKLSKDERDLWRIPPCISNWKNNKGYMIPLDKRVSSDGRNLQEHVISDNFSKFSQALYSAEKNARDLVAKRAALRKKLQLSEQEQREEELRKAAAEARLKRMQISEKAQESETDDETKKRIQREKIREERRREREREHRLENKGGVHKKSKITRDQDRDISEKIALGMSVPKTTEALYDQRLFNQTEGLDSGFGDDENYNIYDKHLFGGERERALYKAPSKDDELYGEKDLSMDKLLNTKRFKPDKDFEGVDRDEPIAPRTGPVQFEQDKEDQNKEENNTNKETDENKKEEDIYGFNKYFNEAKKVEKGKDRQTLGLMHATGGSGVGSEFSQRKNVDFVKSTQDYSKKYRSPSPDKSPKNSPKKRSRSSERKTEKRKRSLSPKKNTSPRRTNNRSPKRRRSRSPRRR